MAEEPDAEELLPQAASRHGRIPPGKRTGTDLLDSPGSSPPSQTSSRFRAIAWLLLVAFGALLVWLLLNSH